MPTFSSRIFACSLGERPIDPRDVDPRWLRLISRVGAPSSGYQRPDPIDCRSGNIEHVSGSTEHRRPTELRGAGHHQGGRSRQGRRLVRPATAG